MAPKNWRLSQNAAIMAVQGPPGTGKTWTACHVIEDILTENPYARILVSAKEHLALDHLTNRIRETLDSSFDVVRICNTEGESLREIDDRALPKTIAERMLNDLSIPKSTMKEVGHLATWVEELAMRTASVVCTTTLDKTMESMQQGALCFDFAIIEEAGKSYPSELIGPLSISRQSLLIGDHLQLPPFELNSISETVADCFRNGIESWGEREARDSVERLLVEQSVGFNERTKFSATNAIRQVEKWLQPFQSIHMMTTGDTLRHQWRMFPALSNAIGKIFYGQQFELRKVNKVSDERLPGIFGEHQNRLLMVDAHAGVEGKHNKSFSNKVEAKIAASNLLELCKIGAEAIIITPYKGQVAEIKSLLPEEFHGKVRTVDGFQGKEADFIILSLVRNNKRTGSARRWGFFRDPRRINVALSRAREGLLLITSQHHIKNTDWSENEGQLTAFVETIAENGKIIMEG
jgi:superfamily I DNA and/or RNA helicase